MANIKLTNDFWETSGIYDITQAKTQRTINSELVSGKAPNNHASTGTTYGTGTSTNYGHVKLTDSLTDTTTAATGGLALSAKAGSDLKGAINQISNPNLLDNWYFVGGGSQAGAGKFPINQRGQTQYTSIGQYTIDRWRKQGSSEAAILTASGLTLPSSGGIRQLLLKDVVGKTLTVSVLLSNGTFGTYTGVLNPSTSTEWTIWVNSLGNTNVSVGIGVENDIPRVEFGAIGGSKTIAAVKLELGSTQTLAHQENGVWVLNEIPNYQQELAKCQRYYIECEGFFTGYGYNSSTFMASIPLPVTMAKAPTVSGTIGASAYFIQDSGHKITALSPTSALFQNGVRISGSAIVDENKIGFVSGLSIILSADL